MRFKAVLFDFNGVILWDREWHEKAWDALSVKVRNKPLSKEENEKYVHGRTPGDTIAFLLQGQNINNDRAKELLFDKEKLYHKIALASPDFKLSPGAEGLFDLLQKSNIKQTIVTSSPYLHIEFYYQHLNLEKWFPIVKIIYDQGVLQSKPAPDVYLAAAKKLNVSIGDCLVVEDAKSGLESAKSAEAGKIIALIQHDNSNLKKLPYIHKFIKNLSQITLEDFK